MRNWTRHLVALSSLGVGRSGWRSSRISAWTTEPPDKVQLRRLKAEVEIWPNYRNYYRQAGAEFLAHNCIEGA